MDGHSRISVIIPAMNAAKWVGAAVDSALAQSLPPLEVIVIDDGSTDNTVEVLRRFENRIKIIHQPNAGAAAARNKGMTEAHGNWLAFLDADDLWMKDKLEKVVDAARLNPDAALFSHDMFVVNEDGEVIGQYCFSPKRADARELLMRNFVMTSTVVVRADVAREHKFRQDLRRRAGCEDWDFWLKVAQKNHIAHIPKALGFYRRLEGSATRSGLDDLLEDCLQVIEEAGAQMKIGQNELELARASAYRASAVRRLAALDGQAARRDIGRARELSGSLISDAAMLLASCLPAYMQKQALNLRRRINSARSRGNFERMQNREQGSKK